ncbi:MAG: GyrI-like domain-containing protein [Candidatus Heimdallarchaeota archaeon]
MEPKIVNKDEMKLIGCVFYGDPFHSVKGWEMENEIGKLWVRFSNLISEVKHQLKDSIINPTISYEVHIDPVVVKEEKKWYVFIGVEVKNFDNAPLEMFCKILPKTKYAIYTAKSTNFREANDYIYKEWLPKSKYKESHSFQIQAYDSTRFTGMGENESEIDFYIPIK